MIPELTPEEIARCDAARISSKPPYFGRVRAWRTVAQAVGISPQRVLKHFAPDELLKYQASLKGSPSKIRIKERGVSRYARSWSESEMAIVIKGYRSGMSPRWCSDLLPEGVGRVMVAKVYATLGEEHGAARAAALAKPPKLPDRKRYKICGLKPARTRNVEHISGRPAAHLIADRDRRADIRAALPANIAMLGDPIFEQSALYKKLQSKQESAGGALGDKARISARS